MASLEKLQHYIQQKQGQNSTAASAEVSIIESPMPTTPKGSPAATVPTAAAAGARQRGSSVKGQYSSACSTGASRSRTPVRGETGQDIGPCDLDSFSFPQHVPASPVSSAAKVSSAAAAVTAAAAAATAAAVAASGVQKKVKLKAKGTSTAAAAAAARGALTPAGDVGVEQMGLRDSLQLQQSIDKLDAKLACIKQHWREGSAAALAGGAGLPPILPLAGVYGGAPQVKSAPATAGGSLLAPAGGGGVRSRLPAAVPKGRQVLPKASVPSPNKAKASREQRISALPAVQAGKQQGSSGSGGGSSRGSGGAATADYVGGWGQGGGGAGGVLEGAGRGAVSCPASASGYLGAGAGVAAWGNVFGTPNTGPTGVCEEGAGYYQGGQVYPHLRQEQQQGRGLPALPRRSPDRQPRVQAWDGEQQQQQYRQWNPDLPPSPSRCHPYHQQQQQHQTWWGQPHNPHQQQQEQAGTWAWRPSQHNGFGGQPHHPHQQQGQGGAWWQQQQQQQWSGSTPGPQWQHPKQQQQQQGLGYGPSTEGLSPAAHGNGMYWQQQQQHPQHYLQQQYPQHLMQRQQQQPVAPSSPLVPTVHYQQTVMRHRATSSSHGSSNSSRPDSSRVYQQGVYYTPAAAASDSDGAASMGLRDHYMQQQHSPPHHHHHHQQQQEEMLQQQGLDSTSWPQQQQCNEVCMPASGWIADHGNTSPAGSGGTMAGLQKGCNSESVVAVGAQVWPPRGVEVTSRKATGQQQQQQLGGVSSNQQKSGGGGTGAGRGHSGGAGSGVIRAYNLQALLS